MGSHYTCRVCEQHLDFCKCPKEMTVNAKAPNARKVTRRRATPVPRPNPVYVHDLDDFKMTLGAMKTIVDGLVSEHGERATIYCDAGHNNVQVMIDPAPNYAKLVTLPDDVLLGNESMTEGLIYKVAAHEPSRVLLETDDPRSVAWVPIQRVEFVKEKS